jgi:glycosyltransferase involved in cell wall biosynthesis
MIDTASRCLTVLHVSTQRGWHGGEEQARQLMLGLRERGCLCAALARENGEFAARIRNDDFEVTTFRGRGRAPTALARVICALRRLRPEVVHFHDALGVTGPGIAAALCGVSLRVASRRVDFPLRSSWPYRLLCHRVIAVSRAVAAICGEGGLPHTMLRVVHDGVDPARARGGDRRRGRAALGLEHDQPLLLTVATLTDHKGHRFLLQALPEIIRCFPRVCAAFAGDGDLRGVLEDEAVKLGVANHVRFLGFRRDVPDLLRAADLFVFPSHMEGLGSSLIDAMFAHVPIVTTTAGGIPDVVGPDGSDPEPVASVVPPRNATSLAHAIIEALLSPQQCAVLALRAEQRAQRLFATDAMVNQTLAVYREIVEAR